MVQNERHQSQRRTSEAGEYSLPLVAVGEDPTFSLVAQRADQRNPPVIGEVLRLVHNHCIKPLPRREPSRSVGHFTRCTVEGFRTLFAAWQAGTTRIEPISRLQVTSGDGDGVPHRILNDCLFTSRNPAAITRYVLDADGSSERQQSSGVWIATAAGSTAAIRSAGLEPPLAPGQEALLFKVREPFQGRGIARILDGRQLPPRGLALTATMPGIDLYLDGPHRRVPLAYGATARFAPCPEPLPLVVR